MNIGFGEISVDIVRSAPETEDLYGGRKGWFWHASHLPARGPYGSPTEALSDFTEWVAAHYDAEGAILSAPASEEAAWAAVFLRNADEFLRSAEGAKNEIKLASACYALELILEGYLLSRGRGGDEYDRRTLRHDLCAAYRDATFVGLPADDARIQRFLTVVAGPYARHELFAFARGRPALADEMDYLTAIRSLHREAELRVLP